MNKGFLKILSLLPAAALLLTPISCMVKEPGANSPGNAGTSAEKVPETEETVSETEGSEAVTSGESAGEGDSSGATEDFVLEIPDPVVAEPTLVTDSESYCVLDDEGTVWLSKEPAKPLKPASVTKVLTALIVVEQVENLEEKVTVSEQAVLNIDVLSSGVSPALRPGETLTVRDLLYALLLPSTNTAGNVLAEYVAGSNEAFAALMNRKCRELGLINSHFKNPHGLDETDHYSCAFDLAVILREAMKNPVLSEILSAESYTIPATEYCAERTFSAGHKMLSGEFEGSEGAIAGKPGWTPEALGTLVTCYEREGKRMYVCTLRSDEYLHYVDTANLADYAYAKYTGILTNLRPEILDFHVSENSAGGLTLSWKTVNNPKSLRLVYWNADLGTASAVFINDLTPEAEMSCCFPLTEPGPYYVQAFAMGADGIETYQSRTVLFTGGESLVPGSINTFRDADYYVNERGLTENHFVEIPGQVYFAGEDGRIRKNCFVDNDCYYADGNGEIVTGWREINGYRYYFQPDGEKAVGQYLIDGIVYSFDENGALKE